jgi:c-di-GMP-binding flagellar brake protein YcgR
MADNNTPVEHASYILTSRTQIIDRLMTMARPSVSINVNPADTAGGGFITSITRVLPDKNIFTIDVSPDAEMNLALKKCSELVFTASVEGIPARFKASGLTSATLGGTPVFAIAIPTSLYWRQRRGFYRLSIPPAMSIICTIPLPDLHEQKFRLLDISQSGFSISTENQRAADAMEVGQFFQECRFSRPGVLNASFTAELCRSRMVDGSGAFRSFQLGLRFVDTTHAFEKGIQDLLFELTHLKKQQREMARERG